MSGIFINNEWHENTDMKCRRCGDPVFESDMPDYSYQCLSCDEDFYDFEVDEQDPNYFPRVMIARHFDGVAINAALEYLLDASGQPRIFTSQPEAEGFMLSRGIPAEELEYLYFVECDNEPKEPEEN